MAPLLACRLFSTGHVDPDLIAEALARLPSVRCGWTLRLGERPSTRRCPAPLTCDLLVVGGGYTGLWTALHAAERNPGARVVLIEAERVGWAASGRNGGFVDASLTHGAQNGKTRWPDEFDQLERARAWPTSTACRPISRPTA